MKPRFSLTTWLARAAGVAGISLLTIIVVFLATSGSHKLAIVGIALPFGLLALAYLGAARAGFALLCIGYALAALSKGKIAAPLGPSLTLSDISLFLGFILLAPRAAKGRHRVSAMYGGGMLLVVTTAFLASAAHPAFGTSLKTLVGMLWCMIFIPLTLAALRPTDRMVRILAWSFITGHMISVLDALATSPLSSRAQGLTDAYNEYAESGLIVIAVCLYLIHRTQRRWLIYGVMVLSLASIYTSGSRGALVSLAAVLVAVPLVERTAVAGTLVIGVVAALAAFVPIASERAGQQSALSRLFGKGTASTTDNLRSQGINNGFTEFLHHPIGGIGLSNLGLIHSNLLEIAVGLGVFGFLGFCLVIAALLRPMFGPGEHRRLAYVAIAFVVFSATAPALTDRSMWVMLSLGFVYFRGFTNQVIDGVPESLTAEQDEFVVHADHVPQLG